MKSFNCVYLYWQVYYKRWWDFFSAASNIFVCNESLCCRYSIPKLYNNEGNLLAYKENDWTCFVTKQMTFSTTINICRLISRTRTISKPVMWAIYLWYSSSIFVDLFIDANRSKSMFLFFNKYIFLG